MVGWSDKSGDVVACSWSCSLCRQRPRIGWRIPQVGRSRSRLDLSGFQRFMGNIAGFWDSYWYISMNSWNSLIGRSGEQDDYGFLNCTRIRDSCNCLSQKKHTHYATANTLSNHWSLQGSHAPEGQSQAGPHFCHGVINTNIVGRVHKELVENGTWNSWNTSSISGQLQVLVKYDGNTNI